MITHREAVAGITAEQLRGFFIGWPNPPPPATHQRTLAGSDCVVLALDDAPGRAVGLGHGKRLWRHAIATARELGCGELVLQSDPHAEGFYRASGARRAGEAPSTAFPDRKLPLMRFPLPLRC